MVLVTLGGWALQLHEANAAVVLPRIAAKERKVVKAKEHKFDHPRVHQGKERYCVVVHTAYGALEQAIG